MYLLSAGQTRTRVDDSWPASPRSNEKRVAWESVRVNWILPRVAKVLINIPLILVIVLIGFSEVVLHLLSCNHTPSYSAHNKSRNISTEIDTSITFSDGQSSCRINIPNSLPFYSSSKNCSTKQRYVHSFTFVHPKSFGLEDISLVLLNHSSYALTL